MLIAFPRKVENQQKIKLLPKRSTFHKATYYSMYFNGGVIWRPEETIADNIKYLRGLQKVFVWKWNLTMVL